MDGLNAPIYGMFRNPRNGCGSEIPFDTGLGYSSAKGYRYKTPQTRNGSGGRKGFSLKDFIRETLIGGVTGGLASSAFYGAGKGIETLKNSITIDSFSFTNDQKSFYIIEPLLKMQEENILYEEE